VSITNKMYKTASHRHRVGTKPLWVGSRGCDDNVTEGDDMNTRSHAGAWEREKYSALISNLSSSGYLFLSEHLKVCRNRKQSNVRSHFILLEKWLEVSVF